MSELLKVVALLKDPSPERRVAAAVVLGAIKAKAPEVRDALVALLKSGGPREQRAAIDALAAVGAKAAVKDMLPFLVSSDADVREGTTLALASFGEASVPVIESARETAPDDLRRALDLMLARLGGGAAFSALLENLKESSDELARTAAMEVRHRIKNAPAADRKEHFAQTLKFLRRKDVREHEEAMVAAVKILGYVEDKKAIEPLLALAVDASLAKNVRTEAVIALRFALGHEKDAPEVVDGLLTLVEKDDRDLGRVSMDTLGNLQMPAAMTTRLLALGKTAGIERARFALAALGSIDDKVAKKALVTILLESDMERANIAAQGLTGEELALAPVLAALADVDAAERAVLLSQVLRSLKEKFSRAQVAKLVEATMSLVVESRPGYESILRVAREIDGEKVGDALRALAADLKKKKKSDKAELVLELLARSGEGSSDDRFSQAMIALKKSKLDTSPTSRARDPALKLIEELVAKNVDVVGLLKKERTIELDARFYLGFHFVEQGEALGEDLLNEVIEKGGRTKLAKMAKNKLKLEADKDA
jgi:HEAT repeat protein